MIDIKTGWTLAHSPAMRVTLRNLAPDFPTTGIPSVALFASVDISSLEGSTIYTGVDSRIKNYYERGNVQWTIPVYMENESLSPSLGHTTGIMYAGNMCVYTRKAAHHSCELMRRAYYLGQLVGPIQEQ